MTRVAFCLTCFERIGPYAEGAFLDLAITMGRLAPDVRVVPFVRHGEACADACNLLMEEVFEEERRSGSRFDRIFWMDDDVLFYAQDFKKLLDSVDDKHSVVFALAFFRGHPHQPAIWRYHMTSEVQDVPARAELRHIRTWPPDTVIPIHCSGLCAAMLHRQVFDLISKPYFAWIEGGYGRNACTPDGYLCAKLNKVGVPLFCHTGVRTKHVGNPQLIDEAYASGFKSEWPDIRRRNLI